MLIDTVPISETQGEISPFLFDDAPCSQCDFLRKMLLDVIEDLIELRTLNALLDKR